MCTGAGVLFFSFSFSFFPFFLFLFLCLFRFLFLFWARTPRHSGQHAAGGIENLKARCRRGSRAEPLFTALWDRLDFGSYLGSVGAWMRGLLWSSGTSFFVSLLSLSRLAGYAPPLREHAAGGIEN